jgi:hypothetical protein
MMRQISRSWVKVSYLNGLFCIIVINGHSDGDFNVIIEFSSK